MVENNVPFELEVKWNYICSKVSVSQFLSYAFQWENSVKLVS